jgi:hypothetical protein
MQAPKNLHHQIQQQELCHLLHIFPAMFELRYELQEQLLS